MILFLAHYTCVTKPVPTRGRCIQGHNNIDLLQVFPASSQCLYFIKLFTLSKIYQAHITFLQLRRILVDNFKYFCIRLSSVYIHQVRGYGRTIAVTTLFTADVKDNFNGDDCTDDIMKKYHSMADIKFQWTYKKGDPTIDMGYMNVAVVKQRILEGLADDRFTRNR